VNNPPSGAKTSLMTNDPIVEIRQNRQHTKLLRKINFGLRVLVIVAVPAVVYYGYYLYQHDYRVQMQGLDKLGQVRIELKESEVTPVVPEPGIIDIVKKRNIFTPVRDTGVDVGRPSTKDAHKFKSSIRVVGITFDQDYEVLIEDLDKKETVLLTKGKSIAGATLVEISEKKLVFELDHNRIELEL
jgi:hypothetical protein